MSATPPTPDRAEMARRALNGGATVLALDGAATVQRSEETVLLQVTDARADESAAIVLTPEQATQLASALDPAATAALERKREK